MNTRPWFRWLLMLILSMGFHIAIAVSYFSYATFTEVSGAKNEGKNGIDIGLGQIGTYVDMTNQLLQKEPKPKEKTEKVIMKTPIKPSLAKKEVVKKAIPIKQLTTNKLPLATKEGDYTVVKKVIHPIQKDTVKPQKKITKKEPKAIKNTEKKPDKQSSSIASIKATGSGKQNQRGVIKAVIKTITLI